jgi:hypothetical protein
MQCLREMLRRLRLCSIPHKANVLICILAHLYSRLLESTASLCPNCIVFCLAASRSCL